MFWSGRLFGPQYSVWDNRPGGTVVGEFESDGVKYLQVEFKHSPGMIYVFLAP